LYFGLSKIDEPCHVLPKFCFESLAQKKRELSEKLKDKTASARVYERFRAIDIARQGSIKHGSLKVNSMSILTMPISVKLPLKPIPNL
jgi:hypothetical protein